MLHTNFYSLNCLSPLDKPRPQTQKAMKIYQKDPDTDKIPYGPLLTVISISFLDAFCMQLIAPNLAFMVRWYYPDVCPQPADSLITMNHLRSFFIHSLS